MSSDRIRIDTDELNDIAAQLERLTREMNDVSTTITGLISTARYVVSEQPGIARNLNSLKSRVIASGAYAGRVARAVRGASADWAAVERSATGTLGEGDDPFGGSGGGGGAAVSGPGGIIPEWILSLIETGTLVKDGIDVAAAWLALTDPVAMTMVMDWLVSTGGKIAGKLGQYDNVVAKWAKGFIEEQIKGAGTPWEAAKGSVSPVGVIIDFATSVYENWSLAEDGNIPRFVTETVAETGTKVAMTMGGAALAALILGPTAPVVAVAAVGAGIVWAVDSVVEWATGKDVAGWVGEGVGILTDAFVDNVVPVIQDGFNAVVDTGKQILDTGKQILDAGANLVSDAADAVCDWFASIF